MSCVVPSEWLIVRLIKKGVTINNVEINNSLSLRMVKIFWLIQTERPHPIWKPTENCSIHRDDKKRSVENKNPPKSNKIMQIQSTIQRQITFFHNPIFKTLFRQLPLQSRLFTQKFNKDVKYKEEFWPWDNEETFSVHRESLKYT